MNDPPPDVMGLMLLVGGCSLVWFCIGLALGLYLG